ncbi:MAG TPA: SDR family NAD(P)-dependent oxidoreductase [Casimicrobiaceae bacterium]|nr:SDR family NAD(P)-dependent oxidoreductase [Casimicrobiaceae bacterium]
MDFYEQTVIVTGASGHLGRAVTAAFAAQGARLVLAARSKAALDSAFGEESAARAHVAADLTHSADAQTLAAQALDRFGRIDVLVNAAGGFRAGEPVHETTDETWHYLFDINARTMLCASRAVVPTMLAQGSGRIVSVAASAALKGTAGIGAYSASKAAVVRLTESMSAELRERGINVNCVLPTTLDTPENREAMPDVDPSRFVALGDLACIIVFLASPAARPIHGAAIPVTGLR